MKKASKDNLKKNFIWNLIGTGLNSFSSLFFLILVTRVNGVDDAGIFSFGFSIACLLFYIGLYCGRVFQVTENAKISDKSFFVSRLITVALMILVTLIYLLIKDYDSFKFLVIFGLCFYKALEAFAEVIYGYFQKYEELYLSGISLTLKNIFGLTIFFLVDHLSHNLLLAILSMIIINILILICYDFYKMRKYHVFSGKVQKSDLLTIFKNGFFPFALSFLALMIINSPKYAIDAFSTNEIQTYFGIIIMPATIISLAATFIVYPFLTTIKDFIKKHQYRELSKFTNKINLVVFTIGAFCTLIAFLIGIPLLELVYGVHLSDYKILLTLIMIGATFNACVYVLFNILISLRKLKLQTFVYLAVAIFSYFLSRILVQNSSIAGAAYAYLISMFVLLSLYYIIMKYTIKKLEQQK